MLAHRTAHRHHKAHRPCEPLHARAPGPLLEGGGASSTENIIIVSKLPRSHASFSLTRTSRLLLRLRHVLPAEVALRHDLDDLEAPEELCGCEGEGVSE